MYANSHDALVEQFETDHTPTLRAAKDDEDDDTNVCLFLTDL